MKRGIIIAVIAVLLLGGGGFWYWQAHAASGTTYRFDEVARGRLLATIGSTGTLQAQEVVDIGAQVLGRVIKIGADPNTKSGIIDWGSEVEGPVVDKDGKLVKLGTILALIDPLLYEAQRDAAQASVLQTQAAVLSAEASVLSAEGDVGVKTAALYQATQDWEQRAMKLFKAPPFGSPKPQADDSGMQRAEYDQFKAAFDSTSANLRFSKANFQVAKAQVNVARAQLKAAEANLRNAQTNLDYCTISAPVSGKVVDRRVNMGQTVVASLSAPSLFLIAKDLKKMEIWATVNEVDVGRIKGGQNVDYTVDALPGRVYHGKVVPQGKLPFRLNATMTSNVVTYTVVVSVENEDELLKPYMTTNLSFIVENKENALLVANAALRWQPTKQQIAPDQRDSYFQLRNKKRSATDPDAQDQAFVWTLGADGFAHYTQVHTGLSDGARTEILGVIGGGELPEHTQVIVGEGRANAAGNSSNPFGVQMFKGKPKE